MKTNLRLDLISYSFFEKIKTHPLDYIKDLGIIYEKAESRPIGDCWVFFNCKNIPDNLPEFITKI